MTSQRLAPRALRLSASTRWAGLAAFLVLAACVPAAPEPAVPAEAHPEPPAGPPLPFRFETLSGTELSSASLRGRLSVIGLVATYDTASQAEAQFLAEIARRHTPRVNVAIVVLEPPENRPMIDAFASTFHLPYPVAIADTATIAGEGPFGGLHHVPSVIILDREGREVYRRMGLAEREEIERALRSLEGVR